MELGDDCIVWLDGLPEKDSLVDGVDAGVYGEDEIEDGPPKQIPASSSAKRLDRMGPSV